MSDDNKDTTCLLILGLAETSKGRIVACQPALALLDNGETMEVPVTVVLGTGRSCVDAVRRFFNLPEAE